MRELIDTYLSDAPGLFAEMPRPGRPRTRNVRRAAHSLKSTAPVWRTVLSAQAKELEFMGKAGTLEGAGRKVAAADVEYARVKAALEQSAVRL